MQKMANHGKKEILKLLEHNFDLIFDKLIHTILIH